MMDKERNKASKEIRLLRHKDPFYTECPNCKGELESRWEHIYYDEANPVRWCHKCDIAWIWEDKYNVVRCNQ